MKTEGSLYYPLFKFFNDNHNLVLLDDEVQEIINQSFDWLVKKPNIKNV